MLGQGIPFTFVKEPPITSLPSLCTFSAETEPATDAGVNEASEVPSGLSLLTTGPATMIWPLLWHAMDFTCKLTGTVDWNWNAPSTDPSGLSLRI
jgi:hypothetical protein